MVFYSGWVKPRHWKNVKILQEENWRNLLWKYIRCHFWKEITLPHTHSHTHVHTYLISLFLSLRPSLSLSLYLSISRFLVFFLYKHRVINMITLILLYTFVYIIFMRFYIYIRACMNIIFKLERSIARAQNIPAKM